MAVAKKDQERITYAGMYGAQARKDGKARTVPQVWDESPMHGCWGLTVSPSPAPTRPSRSAT